MDAVVYCKTLFRMCKSNPVCGGCPLKSEGGCIAMLLGDMEKAVPIVEQWGKDHPVKTRRSEFLKMFPNADLGNILPCDLDKTLLRPHCNDDGGCVICMREYWGAEATDND